MNISSDKEKEMTDSNLYWVFLCSHLCLYPVSPVQIGIFLAAVITHSQKTIQHRGDSELPAEATDALFLAHKSNLGFRIFLRKAKTHKCHVYV